jgi:S1-C subfamily serine protease
VPQTTQEEAIISVVKETSPAVVSIVVSKDMPVYEQYYVNPFGELGEGFGFDIPQYRFKGTQKQEIGGGTGFIISQDGLVLTNKHVVLDDAAEYTILANDGRRFSALVLARDPLQDLAVLKIEAGTVNLESFPVVKLGDSDELQIGQTVITIGNALGELRNTISVGVVSGLGRTITANSGDFVETIEDVIQTDAAINKGNSGGPLLNLRGEVIGINTATVLDAQNIGFAIPVNKAKKDITQIKNSGKIVYPYLGVYYSTLTADLQKTYNLSVDYGAWIGRGPDGKKTAIVVVSGSAAEKAGLQQDDIVLELGGEKVTVDVSLSKLIQKNSPGDKVSLRVMRGGSIITLEATLGERTE